MGRWVILMSVVLAANSFAVTVRGKVDCTAIADDGTGKASAQCGFSINDGTGKTLSLEAKPSLTANYDPSNPDVHQMAVCKLQAAISLMQKFDSHRYELPGPSLETQYFIKYLPSQMTCASIDVGATYQDYRCVVDHELALESFSGEVTTSTTGPQDFPVRIGCEDPLLGTKICDPNEETGAKTWDKVVKVFAQSHAPGFLKALDGKKLSGARSVSSTTETSTSIPVDRVDSWADFVVLQNCLAN